MTEVSVVLPCRNEEQSIGECILKTHNVFEKYNIHGEIIVSDSSTDNSPEIVRKLNVKLVKHNKEGYGRAYLEGFKIAEGTYLFLADPDGTYDFSEIPFFLEYLRNDNYDFVIGNRLAGNIEKGAMPYLHRYIGIPILSLLFRLFFRIKIHDTQCGMRAITKEALSKLNLQTTGMEFASEMIVKAVQEGLRIKEVPIDYYQRKGNSKLRSFADGWRHLRFMLLYCPLFLFFIPGMLLFLFGLVSMLWLYIGSPIILGIRLYFYPMFLSSLSIIIGYQLIIFSFFAKTYAITHLGQESPRINLLYKYITIEKASILGIVISVIGIVIYVAIFLKWIQGGFGALEEAKNSIAALTFIIIGIQTIFSSFMLSILGIKDK